MFYQGDDILFRVRAFSDAKKTNLIDFTTYADVIVYVYTDGCLIAKFKKSANTLKLDDNYILSGVVDSSVTKRMAAGAITVEINIVENSTDVTDGKLNSLGKKTIGNLGQTRIKEES